MVGLRRPRGFSLIELMIVVAIIGVLAAVAIPAFLSYMKKTKTTEAMLQLNKMAKNAKSYHNAQGSFPLGNARVLPGADGTACATADKHFPTSADWNADPTWEALGFQIDDPNLFSYHYDATSGETATGLAVGDLDCDATLITYALALSVSDGLPVAAITEPPANGD